MFRERLLPIVQLACTILDFCNLDVALLDSYIHEYEFIGFQDAFSHVLWPFETGNSLSWLSCSVTSSNFKVLALCSLSSRTSLLLFLA